MTTFPRLVIAFVMFVIFAGCDTTNSKSDPTSLVPQFSPPAPNVDDLESTSASTARLPFTPSPSATPNQTQIVLDQVVYDATQSVVQTKVAQFPRVCRETYSSPNFSPNDLWMEELCYSDTLTG